MQDIFPPNHQPANHQPDEAIKLMSHCPVCHYNYNPFEAKVIEENAGAHLLHIKCRRCQSSILAMIMTSNFGISSVGMVTDLDGIEISRLKDLSEVDSDDVLNVYEILNKDEINSWLA
ncbi:MAG: hypothetical protein WCP18_03065 [bacterium]